MTGELTRLFVVLSLSLRSSLRGLRLIGLASFAAVPTILVAAIASARASPGTLENASELLVGALTLPVVIMVIVLVIAVAQFRNEIDAETLVYLSDRSVGRGTVVFGKYLGAWGASLLLALPAALVPFAVVAGMGGSPSSNILVPAIASAVLLATAAYVGFFLFLGLVSRSALFIGLLFGFLWEELLVLLPGEAPRLTLAFYYRSFLSGETPTGPLSGYAGAIPDGLAAAALVGVTVAFLCFAIVAFRFLETAPERGST
jgi:ABC-type transport system involved in multi-copper enzyme maturation permease subunit